MLVTSVLGRLAESPWWRRPAGYQPATKLLPTGSDIVLPVSDGETDEEVGTCVGSASAGSAFGASASARGTPQRPGVQPGLLRALAVTGA